MPIPVPRLDDRGFNDLVAELVARIPAHTPEWTDPRPGDPGRTLIELVAWLGDTILYRANLIPERNRLAFLRLLDLPLKPALPATGFVAAALAGRATASVAVPARTGVTGGPLPFETDGELEVLPVEGRCFLKRRPSSDEQARFDGPLRGLAELYRTRFGAAGVTTYVTTPVLTQPAAGLGVDIANGIDRCLWLALLAPEGVAVAAARAGLGRGDTALRALNVALVPALRLPDDALEWGPTPTPARVQWTVSTGRWVAGQPEYRTLDVLNDGTNGLTRAGVVRLVLPDDDDLGVPVDASDAELSAGVGNRPPRIDDARLAARVVCWVRLRFPDASASAPLTWAGINAVGVTQLTTQRNLLIGTADGSAAPEFRLPLGGVERSSFALAVAESGAGFVPWRLVDELAAAGRDDRVARLDAEAGILRFGDGVRGKAPPTGARIVALTCRSGGGTRGNLPPNALKGFAGISTPLTLAQPLPTTGGMDAETLDQAERRLPARLAHGERAVVPEDFRRLALETPALLLARAEVLPRFKPQQRLNDVPGVVSVLVLPPATALAAPHPRPDRRTLERVHAHLDARRLLGTELYVIGADYIPCAASIAVRLADGAPRDAVLRAVRDAVLLYTHPLAPGGRQGTGWALGETVREGELEVIVARVPGIAVVGGIRIFRRAASGTWQLAPRDARAQTRLELRSWQLPEMLEVVVAEADSPSEDPSVFSTGADGAGNLVAIPVVPKTC